MTNKKTVETLRALSARRGGLLKPEDIVEEARDGESPLHKHFTWDDGEAADKYRLMEAQRLIQVVVEYLPNDKSEKPRRVFVSLRKDRATGGGYRKMIDVLSNEELKAQLIDDFLEEMRFAQARYREAQELAGVFHEVERVEKEHRKRKK